MSQIDYDVAAKELFAWLIRHATEPERYENAGDLLRGFSDYVYRTPAPRAGSEQHSADALFQHFLKHSLQYATTKRQARLDRPKTLDPDYQSTITLSCNRETDRLDRLLVVFRRAQQFATARERKCLDGIHIARSDLGEILNRTLISLHDHKGCLTVRWTVRAARSIKGSVMQTLIHCLETAWIEQNEETVCHLDARGNHLCGEQPYWRGDEGPCDPKLYTKD